MHLESLSAETKAQNRHGQQIVIPPYDCMFGVSRQRNECSIADSGWISARTQIVNDRRCTALMDQGF